MTEPTYEYIKGQGWVVQPPHPVSDVYTLKTGERFRFEFRKPRPGEYYDAASKGSRWFPGEVPDWDDWGSSYSYYSKHNLCEWFENWKFDSSDEYITIVLL